MSAATTASKSEIIEEIKETITKSTFSILKEKIETIGETHFISCSIWENTGQPDELNYTFKMFKKCEQVFHFYMTTQQVLKRVQVQTVFSTINNLLGLANNFNCNFVFDAFSFTINANDKSYYEVSSRLEMFLETQLKEQPSPTYAGVNSPSKLKKHRQASPVQEAGYWSSQPRQLYQASPVLMTDRVSQSSPIRQVRYDPQGTPVVQVPDAPQGCAHCAMAAFVDLSDIDSDGSE